MTSSGTYSFAISNGGAIIAAYERLQIFAPQLRVEHQRSAITELNLLFSEASNRQVNLWKVDQQSVALTSGVASLTVPQNTVMVLDAWITTGTGTAATDRYITPISRTVYASLSNKQSPGAPTQFWFDRLITPTLTLWPVPDQTGIYTLNYFRCLQMQDANLPGGETPDIPYRWYDWMVAGLSHRLSRIYRPNLEAQREKDADNAWLIASTQDTEGVNVAIAPPLGRYYGR